MQENLCPDGEQNRGRYNNYIISQLSKSVGKDFKPKSLAIKVAAIYIVFGLLWVLFSDNVLMNLVDDKNAIALISMIKGWAYVVLTGMLIYTLIYYTLKRIKSAEDKLLLSYQKLTDTHHELETAYKEIAVSQAELRQKYEEALENQGRLKASEERYRLITEASNDGIWDWDVRNDKKYYSERWYDVLGYSKDELEAIGSWHKLVHNDDLPYALYAVNQHKNEKTDFYCCEYRVKTKNNDYKWILARGKALFDDKGNVYRMAGSHSDITELKVYQDKLKHRAYHDLLTGLPNRLSMNEKLTRLFQKDHNSKGAFLFIDSDNFKLINDALGHTFGDQVIIGISERLSEIVEGDSLLFRLGGDEFVLYLRNILEAEDVKVFADKLLDRLKTPFELNGSTIHTSVSIGIALYPEDGRSVDELLKSADIAMYKLRNREGINMFFMKQ